MIIDESRERYSKSYRFSEHTLVPIKAIEELCENVKDFNPKNVKISSLLFMDMPGNESFIVSTIRKKRYFSVCDLLILVIDMVFGIESNEIIQIAKRHRHCIIVLNKLDRLFGYKSNPCKDIWQHLESQSSHFKSEFQTRYEKIVTEFSKEGINAMFANMNTNSSEYMPIVPISAYHGDGIGNLISCILEYSQTCLSQKLAICQELDCTILESRDMPGFRTPIDVVIKNGILKKNDTIVLMGKDGVMCTVILEILVEKFSVEFQDMFRNKYEQHEEITGVQIVKILANGLKNALLGLPLFVAHSDDDIDQLKFIFISSLFSDSLSSQPQPAAFPAYSAVSAPMKKNKKAVETTIKVGSAGQLSVNLLKIF
uniref:Tr-type G domain-containing protein n=1 Tax=Acrobeloides nanus TaxID=290746 RepID=A0A914DW93_9BILA